MVSSSAKHLYGILKCPSINALRLMRGSLSQTSLASMLKVSPTTVTDWETGKKSPTTDHLLKLLKHYLDWTRQLELPGLEILVACEQDKQPATLPHQAAEGK